MKGLALYVENYNIMKKIQVKIFIGNMKLRSRRRKVKTVGYWGPMVAFTLYGEKLL